MPETKMKDAKATRAAFRKVFAEEYEGLSELMEFLGSPGRPRRDENAPREEPFLIEWVYAAHANFSLAAFDLGESEPIRTAALPPGLKWVAYDGGGVRNCLYAKNPFLLRVDLVAEGDSRLTDERAVFGLANWTALEDLKALLYDNVAVYNIGQHPPFQALYAPDAQKRYVRYKGNLSWLDTAGGPVEKVAEGIDQ